MIRFNKTRLNTLYWETKTRISYCLFSFIFCFFIAYKKKIALLYLFVSSYEKAFTNNVEYSNTSYLFSKEISNMITRNAQSQKSEVYWQYENPKTISNVIQWLDLSSVSDKDLITLLEGFKCRGASSIKFIFTDVEEAFSTTIIICLIFSFIISMLYFVYVIFSFLAPSMYYYEASKWFHRTFFFVALWVAFIIYLQNTIIPKLALFLLTFQIQSVGFNVEAVPKIYSYCVWASTLFLIANLIFLFVFSVIFAIINRNINIKYFIIHRKWCGVFLLLISALIAPPDLFAQLFLVIILLFFLNYLFTFSLFIST